MNKYFVCYVCLILSHIVSLEQAAALEAQSGNISLQYANMRILREFNNKLIIGRKLSSMIRDMNAETVEEEVLAKLNVIIDKIQAVLDMYPDKLHITVVLLSDDNDVADMYENKYGKHQEYIAYYSLSEKTIYISVDDTTLGVIAHEMGHAVADQYFEVRPPYKIHELMAQFAEKHVTD